MEQMVGSQWWTSYQPVSYKLDNRLGNESAFKTMVDTCRRCGVGIIADAVTNHMAAGQGSGSSGSSFTSRSFPGTYSPADFHHNNGDTSSNCVISNYQDKWNVQHCDLVGLPDLDSSADWPRKSLGAYLTHLSSLGVAGLRVDAAKHQDATELGGILSPVKGLEVYQEVIGAPGEAVEPSEYVMNGGVTEFGYSYALSNAVRAGQMSQLRGLGQGLLPSSSALAFIDNHDSQRASTFLAASAASSLEWSRVGYSASTTALASGVLTYKEGAAYAVAAAFMLAWPYGRVRLMSSYYFDDHDAGPPATPVHDASGAAACGEGKPWVCEHRWPSTAGMVGWRLAAGDSAVANWQEDGSGHVAFSRGHAFAAFAAPSAGVWSASLQTGLPAGAYCNVAAGDSCAEKVTVGKDGVAAVSVQSVVGIHTGAAAPATVTVA